MAVSRKDNEEPEEIKVEDKRHWALEDDDDGGEDEAHVPSTQPTIIDEYRKRTEEAENRLQEYIEAFKQSRDDQEKFRVRLERDVGRKVELKFGGMVTELLECMDDLELAAEHVSNLPEAEPLARGVLLVRERFLSILERNGVERFVIEGDSFDPNLSEAVRIDPVDDAEMDGKVTETIRPGYSLGDRVIRPARVAVGKQS